MVTVYGDRYTVRFNMVKQVSLRPLMQYVFVRAGSFLLGCMTVPHIVLRTEPIHELVYTGRRFFTQNTPKMSKNLYLGGDCT